MKAQEPRLSLTDARRRVLEAIERHIVRHGWPPSIREICEVVGNTSTATVAQKLVELEKMGLIQLGGGARMIRVTKRGKQALGISQSADVVAEIFRRHWEWSQRTFGPGQRTRGILEHIRRELAEIEQDPTDLTEWIDVILLAVDGFHRHGGRPEELLPSILAKQLENFARKWPPPGPEDQPVEHIREETTAEVAGR